MNKQKFKALSETFILFSISKIAMGMENKSQMNSGEATYQIFRMYSSIEDGIALERTSICFPLPSVLKNTNSLSNLKDTSELQI
jgi:hypothetical protein